MSLHWEKNTAIAEHTEHFCIFITAYGRHGSCPWRDNQCTLHMVTWASTYSGPVTRTLDKHVQPCHASQQTKSTAPVPICLPASIKASLNMAGFYFELTGPKIGGRQRLPRVDQNTGIKDDDIEQRKGSCLGFLMPCFFYLQLK